MSSRTEISPVSKNNDKKTVDESRILLDYYSKMTDNIIFGVPGPNCSLVLSDYKR